MHLKLSFTNEVRALPGVRAIVGSTLGECSLPAVGSRQLSEVVTAAVEAAVQNAYPSSEQGLIKVTVREGHGRVEVRVRDFGLPQDVAVLEKQLREGGLAADGINGGGGNEVVDKVHWLAFGPRGKALQLVKWLPSEHVANGAAVELAPAAPDAPLAPPQEYDVRRMRPEEAVQVAQLIYRTYGMTYFNKDVYYPERIAAHNARGDVISVVAVGEDGRVAGHCALERGVDGPVAEVGQAAVDPTHRGRGLLDRMKLALEAEARSLGMAGWFADAVAVHTMTQQSNAHHGGHVCAIDLAVSPKSEAFRQISAEQTQRVSCVLYFHWLDEPRPRKVFVPARHREIIAAIYENLKCPTEFAEAAAESPTHGEMTSSLDKGSAVGTIRVGQIGTDSVLAIRHAMRQLVERSHAKVVDIELPMEDSATPALCEALEADGVAFTGVGPHFSPRGDVLKLAYLVKPLEREPIKTFEPIAERLVEYALAEQARVRANI